VFNAWPAQVMLLARPHTINRMATPRVDASHACTFASAAFRGAVDKPVIAPLAMQSPSSTEAVAWDASSTLTQLLTVATVCNKAKFDDASGGLGT
jgi:hypothetical protein